MRSQLLYIRDQLVANDYTMVLTALMRFPKVDSPYMFFQASRANVLPPVVLLRFTVGVLKLLIFGYCDNSMREKDWRCRKRGTQAT
jgi:hypothetical protein